jgi:plastocyanin
MRRWNAGVFAAVLLAGCGSSYGMTSTNTFPNLPGGASAATATISVENNVFNPVAVKIVPGGTVTWNWVGSGHSVTSFGTPAFTPNAPVSNAPNTLGPVTFATTGDYQFFCTVHGAGGVYGGGSMAGVVFVR